MTTFIWRGPLGSRNGEPLVPGQPVELDLSDPLVQGYRELGYLQEAGTPPKTKLRKGEP